METSETVTVRIAGDTADALARRAQTCGLSRQEYIDQVLRREALYGSEPWARPVEVAPGLLPQFAELANAPKGQYWALVYRDLAAVPWIILGVVERTSPLVLYVRPRGHRTVPIARAHLIAWEPVRENTGDLFEVIPGWFYAGARLHPTIPADWAERLMPRDAGR